MVQIASYMHIAKSTTLRVGTVGYDTLAGRIPDGPSQYMHVCMKYGLLHV